MTYCDSLTIPLGDDCDQPAAFAVKESRVGPGPFRGVRVCADHLALAIGFVTHGRLSLAARSKAEVRWLQHEELQR